MQRALSSQVAGGLLGGAVGGPAGAALGVKAAQAATVVVSSAAGAAFGYSEGCRSATKLDMADGVKDTDAAQQGARVELMRAVGSSRRGTHRELLGTTLTNTSDLPPCAGCDTVTVSPIRHQLRRSEGAKL